MSLARPILWALVSTLPLLGGCDPATGSGAGDTPRGLDAPDAPLTLESEPLFSVGAMAGEDWETFGQVSNVAFDRGGRLFVYDAQASRVVVVDPEGRFLRSVGSPGDGPGEFRMVMGTAVAPDGSIVAFDMGHQAFQRFSPDGEYVGSVPVDLATGGPGRGFHLHPDGSVVAANRLQMRLSAPSDGDDDEVEPAGRPVTRYSLSDGGQTDIFMAWALPEPAEEVSSGALSTPSGGSFTISGPPMRAFEPGIHLGVLSDGRMVLADSVGYRLKVLSAEGALTAVLERPVEPEVVTEPVRDEERERRLAALEEGGAPTLRIVTSGGGGSQMAGGGVQRMMQERIEAMIFAGEVPVIQELRVDRRDRLWVRRAGPGGIPGTIDILTVDGEYLGSLTADDARIPDAFGPDGRVAYIHLDELDVPTVRVERLGQGWR